MNPKVAAVAVLVGIGLIVPLSPRASQQPVWQRALAIRGAAADRTHNIGRYAVPRAATARTTAEWYRALELRSKSLNGRYGLGRFAPATAGDAFDWTAAGIGAAVATGVCVLLAALAVTARARLVARA